MAGRNRLAALGTNTGRPSEDHVGKAQPFLWAAFLLGLAASGLQAATWQEHKLAGFSAFDAQNYGGAVERFQTALVIAYEQGAAPDDLGAILKI